jgi:hypothetical protein
MFYTFPPKDMWSDIVAVDGGSRALPGTPWTGFMYAGVSLAMAFYFASCLVEWYGDRSVRKFHAENDRFNQQKIDNDRLADERNAAQEAAQEAAHYAATREAEQARRDALPPPRPPPLPSGSGGGVRGDGLPRAGFLQPFQSSTPMPPPPPSGSGGGLTRTCSLQPFLGLQLLVDLPPFFKVLEHPMFCLGLHLIVDLPLLGTTVQLDEFSFQLTVIHQHKDSEICSQRLPPRPPWRRSSPLRSAGARRRSRGSTRRAARALPLRLSGPWARLGSPDPSPHSPRPLRARGPVGPASTSVDAQL